MRGAPKKRWSPRCGKATESETAYLRSVARAREAGRKAAGDPKATEAACPTRYDEDQRSYWLIAFRAERRRP